MVWSSRSYQRMSSSSFFVNEKKLSPPVLMRRRFSICARSHERLMTAWALSSSGDDVADISLEMTLVR